MRARVITVGVALCVACKGSEREVPKPPAKLAGVRVVDLIPVSLSGESWQDAEPFLALYASNPRLMAASAFTPNPGGSASATAPIFVSDDGGDSWTLRNRRRLARRGHDLYVPAHRNPQHRGAEWSVHPARRGTGSHRVRRVLRLALERGSGRHERRRRGARRQRRDGGHAVPRPGGPL